MSTGTRLDPILESVRLRAAERRKQYSLQDLRQLAVRDLERRRRFHRALSRAGLSFIAECKRRSPSAGTFSEAADLLPRAQAYAEGGADALSILTEEDHFRGNPEDFQALASVGLPRLRKDFLLDEGMVRESSLMQADCVLLIALCLPGGLLGELRAVAGELGMAVLVEVHQEAEVERAVAVEPDLIGVNCRDLTRFETDLKVFERLLPLIPASFLRVAESGLHQEEDLHYVRQLGADGALIGEALMRQEEPAEVLKAWKEALGGGASSVPEQKVSEPDSSGD
ncbi:MAG: indole-3-glycerol-phosphate synthase [Planctomycetota bacterium]|nr:MAG: indole-3-glycerol-phosphate synthase [Planctomycetota bacterium]